MVQSASLAVLWPAPTITCVTVMPTRKHPAISVLSILQDLQSTLLVPMYTRNMAAMVSVIYHMVLFQGKLALCHKCIGYHEDYTFMAVYLSCLNRVKS